MPFHQKSIVSLDTQPWLQFGDMCWWFKALVKKSINLKTRCEPNRTEFRSGVAFEVELCNDSAFDKCSCGGFWWSPKIRAAKSEDALM